MNDPTKPSFIHLVPTVPVEPRANVYTLFSNRFFAPSEYSGWIDESESWKKTCYIGDWSPLLKLLVSGPGALDFFSAISVNSFKKFDLGQAKHAVMCNSSGKVMGEGILMRLESERFLLTGSPAVRWAEYQFAGGTGHRGKATAHPLGSTRFITQVQGPTSLQTLEKATGESLRDIEFMRFKRVRIAGRDVEILRQGMAGEIGYELHGALDDGMVVYNAVLEAGREFGIRRLGERTKMVNHVEACFPTFGVDYLPDYFAEDEKPFADWMEKNYPGVMRGTGLSGSYAYKHPREFCRTPTELGWGKNVKFDHDFIGAAALKAEAENPRRKIVTLVWNSDDVVDVYASHFREGEPYEYMEMPRNLTGTIVADAVTQGDSVVGVSTSRCYSYSFRRMLSLCVIDIALSKPGSEVTLIWGRQGMPQRRIRATVAPAPYKKDNRRTDVSQLAATT